MKEIRVWFEVEGVFVQDTINVENDACAEEMEDAVSEWMNGYISSGYKEIQEGAA